MGFIGKGIHYFSFSPYEDNKIIIEKIYYIFNIPIFLKTRLAKKNNYNKKIISELKNHPELILRGTYFLGYIAVTKENYLVGKIPWVWRTVGELQLINLKRSSDKIRYINLGYSKKYNTWIVWTKNHDIYWFGMVDEIFIKGNKKFKIENLEDAETVAKYFINQKLKERSEI